MGNGGHSFSDVSVLRWFMTDRAGELNSCGELVLRNRLAETAWRTECCGGFSGE